MTGQQAIYLLRKAAALILLGSTVLACSKPTLEERDKRTKFRQYYVQGEKLYIQHCSNCHQKDGTGLGLVYPPVNQSDFVDQNFRGVVCLIRNGIQGELVVNGKVYNQPMPPMPLLSDLEIAEITTFLYNNWNRSKGLVSVNEVTELQRKCGQD